MIKKFLIDGNNLMGKIPELKNISKEQKQLSRERLAAMLDRYFAGKKVKAVLYFDGFAGPAINTSSLSIHYSNSRTADDLIRHDIECAKNPKLLTVVSSDNSIASFARACSCEIIKSEKMRGELSKKETNIEAEKIKAISNEEIKRLFSA